MKRIASVLLLLVMLVSLFAFSPAALATGDTPPETETPAPEPTPTPEPQVLNKLTTTLDRTPVVLLAVSEPKATVSSKNASLVSLTWYDPLGNALPGNSAFDYMTYRMEIIARADDGYLFSSSLNAYLNNSATDVSVSPDGKTATISREYEALVFAPRIIKHPGEETVDEGSFVSYVSTAAYATGLTWEFISPDGQTVFDSKDLVKTFPESNCNNDGKEKIVIYNVTREMDGWQVRAVFTGAESTVTRSNPVTIKVTPDPNRKTPEETPSPEETPEPTETPAPTEAPVETPVPTEPPVETPAPTEAPVETPAPSADHEHQFAQVWTADETRHWHECACGARAEEGEHDMRWRTLSVENDVATQEGVCKVCGYQETKQITVSSTRIINKVPMGIVFAGALGLMAVLVIAESVKRGKRS
ncbi:MAG: hypothetical protein ACSW8E_01075 [Clostridia bacterium]